MGNGNENDGSQTTQSLDSLMNDSQIIVGEDIDDTPAGGDKQVAGQSPAAGQGEGDPALGDQDHQGSSDDGAGTGDDEAGSGDDESGAGGDEAGAGGGDDDSPKPRFKDHLAAEEGYKNLQSKNTRVETELAEYKKKEAAEKAAEQKLQGDGDFLEFCKGHRKAAIAEINDLDGDDPEHDDKVAAIWANNDLVIHNYQAGDGAGGGGDDGGGDDTAGAEAGGGDDTAGAEAGGGDDTAGADEKAAADKYIVDTLKEAKLDKSDPVLIGFVNEAPVVGEDEKPLTLEQQMDWVVKQTQNFYATQRQKFSQENDQGMGTGSNPGPGPGGGDKDEKVEPSSLGSIMDKVEGERRITT